MEGRCRHRGWAAGLLAGAGVLAAPMAAARASAAIPPAPETVQAVLRSDSGDSQRERVIEAVQQRYHAQVVRVAETSVNGRPALELRLLSEQRVWNLLVDAATGQVLSGH